MSNKFIEDCLAELANNPIARERFNQQGFFKAIDGVDIKTGANAVSFLTNERIYRFDDFHKHWQPSQVYIILVFLSRKDGQAVMPFLDVEVATKKDFVMKVNNELPDSDHRIIADQTKCTITHYLTLDHLLYREFTEALRTSKTFGEALAIIEKIYQENI